MTDSVLVVEDDADIGKLIAINLTELALDVDLCVCGIEGLGKALSKQYALIMLDVMLPGISGLDICKQVRDKKPEQQIMMLTSRDSEADRVVGLELGADDYMAKPFSVRELQARVRAQIRRFNLSKGHITELQKNNVISLGKMTIDSDCHKATLSGKELDLTSTEFELLQFFARHPNQVFSREQLLSSVWGYQHSGYEHTVNSHINRLRNKLETKPTKPEIVQTVWGVGYKLNSLGVG